ncbi:hypothetical protein UY3_02469 [Chelonia mydas]|uniref:Uncharacterized protein n=1 Tax=Chelonia mydas TaxID=8469 RepID=M7BR02_CHEMY|nr:hypothetical protein UY3_02469 [Chelonia mydas]
MEQLYRSPHSNAAAAVEVQLCHSKSLTLLHVDPLQQYISTIAATGKCSVSEERSQIIPDQLLLHFLHTEVNGRFPINWNSAYKVYKVARNFLCVFVRCCVHTRFVLDFQLS